MMATRAGPFLLGWIAVVTLPSQDYGSFVLAFAWVNAIVGICLGLFPALVSRTAVQATSNKVLIAELTRLGMPLIAGLALVAVALSPLRDPEGATGLSLRLATGWACLTLGVSNLLAIICWSLGQSKPLIGLALLESLMHAIWLTICGTLAWETFVIMLGIGGISAAISMGFLRSLIQHKLISHADFSLAQNSKPQIKFTSLLGPNLINTLAMSLSPALALSIASARGPDFNIEVIFGLALLWISAGLFPLQILTLSRSQNLIKLRAEPGALRANRLNMEEWTLIGVSVFWGIMIAGLVLWLGPKIGETPLSPFSQLMPYLGQVAWIMTGWAFLAAVGPILQAQHRYGTWSAINLAGCLSLLFYASYAALSPAALLVGTSLSVLIRCGFAVASLSVRVN